MQHDLLGYLLGALDEDEQKRVEAQLHEDPELREQLKLLERSLMPLDEIDETSDPPPGLARRTLSLVESHRGQPAISRPAVRSRLRLADMLASTVACSIVALLLFPAILNARFTSRVNSCQMNLRNLGTQLVTYAESHKNRHYPPLDASGKFSFAGMTPIQLREAQLLDARSPYVICAGAGMELSQWSGIPDTYQIRQAVDDTLERLQEEAGGSYGWYLGVYVDGVYQSPRYLGRSNFVIVADAPNYSREHMVSTNHASIGINLLFDDQHVEFVKACRMLDCGEDHLRNDAGFVGAGSTPNDSVVGLSAIGPFPRF